MPAMMVWPDSSSVLTRNDGSSCARRCSAMPIFSWSALVFGSTACEITGSGNTMRSSVTMASGIAQGFARGHFLQAHAGGDVAGADFLDFFAVVGVHLHDTADALLLAADRVVDAVARLQHARVDAHEGQLADERVGHQLERQRRELLARRRRWRATGLSSSSVPGTGGMSIGDGMYSMTASSMRCTPLFLNAEPHSIGWISPAMVRVRMPSLDLGLGQLARLRGTCSSALRSTSAAASTMLLAPLRAASASSSAGISP